MTKVQGSKDCGNSPKNKFVQDVAIAIESGKAKPEIFSEDLIWEQSSMEPISGRAAVLEQLASQKKPSLITIHHAISHGKVGAVSGEVTFAKGDVRRFCHVLEFTNTKANCVAVIRSYS